MGIEDKVLIELRSVYPDHAALFDRVTQGTATPQDLEVWAVLRQYVQYEAAAFLLPQFQMLVVQKISDGDAEMARFQNNNLQDTITRILAMRDRYRTLLLGPDPIPPHNRYGIFTAVQPSYDPVTHEGWKY